MCFVHWLEEEYHCWLKLTLQVVDFPGGKVPFTPEMKFINEISEERIPCYRVLDDTGHPIAGSSFINVYSLLSSCTLPSPRKISFLWMQVKTLEDSYYLSGNWIRSVRKLPKRCTAIWSPFKPWILSFMKHKGKEEFPSMSHQSERRPSMLLPQQL